MRAHLKRNLYWKLYDLKYLHTYRAYGGVCSYALHEDLLHISLKLLNILHPGSLTPPTPTFPPSPRPGQPRPQGRAAHSRGQDLQGRRAAQHDRPDHGRRRQESRRLHRLSRVHRCPTGGRHRTGRRCLEEEEKNDSDSKTIIVKYLIAQTKQHTKILEALGGICTSYTPTHTGSLFS